MHITRLGAKTAARAGTVGLVLISLAGCGDTFGEQALIGGAAGAGTAAVLDGNVALGALVGAAGNVAYCDRYPERC